jgi:hypothetical protein
MMRFVLGTLLSLQRSASESQMLLLSLMGLSSAVSSGLIIGSGMCTIFVSGWRIVFFDEGPAAGAGS